jgi:hypothetical protein
MIYKRAIARLRAQDWVASSIELVIVTLGVILALAAQEWAERRSWQAKIDASKSALREELAEQYGYAVEFRVVYPCLRTQLDMLRQRVLSSGASLNPAPVYSEPNDEYVLRMPIKFYPTDAWEEAINDGVVQRFDPTIRRQLAGLYASLENLAATNAANIESEQASITLARPLPLDPSTRYSVVEKLDQMTQRFQWLDVMNGQLLDYIEHVGMVPPAAQVRAVTERYGTYRFCRAHRLPMRSYTDAMQSVPN